MADKDKPKGFPGYYIVNNRKVRPDGSEVQGNQPAVETPEQVRIRELEAQIEGLRAEQEQAKAQVQAAEERGKQQAQANQPQANEPPKAPSAPKVPGRA